MRVVEEAEAGALMMVCAKLARIATGPVLHMDNYTDAAAYIAIAGEVAHTQTERDESITLEDLIDRWKISQVDGESE